MKKCFNYTAFLLCAGFFILSFKTAATKVDFSGNWKLDKAKSKLGSSGADAPFFIKVDQKSSTIIITSVKSGLNQNDSTTVTIPYDGEVTISQPNSTLKNTMSAKWSNDGESLIISNIFDFGSGGQNLSKETWTLTKDGMLSIVTVYSRPPRGNVTWEAIYGK